VLQLAAAWLDARPQRFEIVANSLASTKSIRSKLLVGSEL
jgi:hypothetical protein